ncbi:PilZ domain-containing protein [Thiovibrio frasassiensis]|uniref:PilZ domain-containing protein n=1 Tax=Thiovibrio frasassiensis TaxID=2984131 RepID=A0A9X4ME03_9BACT|nr:PilZ domain-containing protein [Thiovibrio frasassiensis]MDG4474543.1 PilZ domain-containing protein [Thiovibrio frasassiensis]
MQELWSDDPKVVGEEIIRIVGQRIPVTLFQKGLNPQKLTPSEIFIKEGARLLLLAKESPFQSPQDPCLLLYQHQNQPMRGFHTSPMLETSSELGVLFPSSIITIQRRKYPRYVTSPRSVATFTRKASQYLNHGIIKNISIEGARVVGKFSQHIQKGDKLSPLSMTLRLKFGDFEEKATAPEAIVRRITEIDQETREFGVHFTLKGTDRENLERYLSICSIEDSPPNAT